MIAVNRMLYYKSHRNFENEYFICLYIDNDSWFVEITVGDDFLDFCGQIFIKTCLGLDGYDVVTASNLERNVSLKIL
jgi:hypothetical protein